MTGLLPDESVTTIDTSVPMHTGMRCAVSPSEPGSMMLPVMAWLSFGLFDGLCPLPIVWIVVTPHFAEHVGGGVGVGIDVAVGVGATVGVAVGVAVAVGVGATVGVSVGVAVAVGVAVGVGATVGVNVGVAVGVGPSIFLMVTESENIPVVQLKPMGWNVAVWVTDAK